MRNERVDWNLILFLKENEVNAIKIKTILTPSGIQKVLCLHARCSSYTCSKTDFYSVFSKIDLTRLYNDFVYNLDKKNYAFDLSDSNFSEDKTFRDISDLRGCIKESIKYLLKNLGLDFESLSEIDDDVTLLFNSKVFGLRDLSYNKIEEINDALKSIGEVMATGEKNKKLYDYFFND